MSSGDQIGSTVPPEVGLQDLGHDVALVLTAIMAMSHHFSGDVLKDSLVAMACPE